MLTTEDKRWLTDMFDVRLSEQDKRIDAKFTEQDKQINILREEMYELNRETSQELRKEMYELNRDTRHYYDIKLENEVYPKLEQILEVIPGAGQSFANHEERITVLEKNDRDKTQVLTSLSKQIRAAK